MLDEIIAKVQNVGGVDLIYFLDNTYQVIKEKRNNIETNNYLEQILNIIKLESITDELGTTFYSKVFHTYTLLNETGLVVISKISNLGLYMIVIAGENDPVDLINLLKICKEVRLQEVRQ